MGWASPGSEYRGDQADHFVGMVSVEAVLDDTHGIPRGFEYRTVTVRAVTESAGFFPGWALNL